MGVKKTELLARELALNPSVRMGERHESPYVVQKLCRIADELTTNGDHAGLRAARRAVQIAGRLAGPWRCRTCRRSTRRTITKSDLLAQAFARLAAALRLALRLDHAEKALKLAFEMGSKDLRADLYRRRAILRIYQKRRADALKDARTALRLSRAGQERARAVKTLAGAYLHSGAYAKAIRHLAEAVETLDPADEYRFTAALVSYAAALAQGSDEDVREALQVCADARARLKDQHRMQRANLWWVEGLLHRRLGDGREAWRALDTARRSFVALKAAPEVGAVTADMALVSPLPRAVANLCHEARPVIAEFHPLAVPLHDLRTASRAEIPSAAGKLRKAAASLASCPAL